MSRPHAAAMTFPRVGLRRSEAPREAPSDGLGDNLPPDYLIRVQGGVLRLALRLYRQASAARLCQPHPRQGRGYDPNRLLREGPRMPLSTAFEAPTVCAICARPIRPPRRSCPAHHARLDAALRTPRPASFWPRRGIRRTLQRRCTGTALVDIPCAVNPLPTEIAYDRRRPSTEERWRARYPRCHFDAYQ